MHNYVVTDYEIEKAEQDIFKNKSCFNDSQRKFLRYLGCCYLQAYAGTGKTSAIVGKLHILAQKNIWTEGRGICVISHTNVAVNEIKKYVAKHYPTIMEYPNFIGTIQEFVNKFLFIPYLVSRGLQIKFQDNSRYFDYKKEIDDLEIIQRINNQLKKISISQNSDTLKNFIERFRTIHLNNGRIYAESRNGEIKEYTDLKTNKVPQDRIVVALSDLIEKQHNRGAFLFKESFIYGNEYLNQNPALKNIISQRFQFVFLDEAQDCSEIQLKILNELFGRNSKTIFQQIGDVNQAISETKWEPDDPCLCLEKSLRFGQNITDFINKFKIDTGPGVSGCSESTKEFLIVYSSDKKNDVLSNYAEILKTEEKVLKMNKCYFAISYKHDQLRSYFSNYSERVAKNKNKKVFFRFENDIEYINLITIDSIKNNGSNFVSNIIFNLLYKHYKKEGGSRSELKKVLRDSDKADYFNKLVLEICNDVLLNKSISNFEKIRIDLNNILGEEIINFMHNSNNYKPDLITISDNIFKSSDGIEVKIGTIHSVKGETHDSTLLFSNKEHNKQDIQHSIDKTPKYTPKYKKLLYVASSRAKHLFVFAIENDAYGVLKDKSCFKDFKLIKI